MADKNDKPKSVALWKDNHGWVVYAGIRDNGDVEICSDGTHEWYAIVPASGVGQLKSALAAAASGNKSESVLPLLFKVFGRAPEAENPFEDIKRFLDAHSIPWKSDFWNVDRKTQAALESARRQYVASGGKPMTTEPAKPDDRFSHFKYYLLGDTIPVRFSVSTAGGFYDAERPGEKKGSLTRDISLIGRFDEPSAEFEEIGKAEFEQRVRDYVRRPPVKDSQAR